MNFLNQVTSGASLKLKKHALPVRPTASHPHLGRNRVNGRVSGKQPFPELEWLSGAVATREAAAG